VSRSVELSEMLFDRTAIRAARLQRPFDTPLLVAAVLSIPATILQSTRVSAPWDTIGAALNWAIWIAFLSELVVMLAITPNRSRYLLEHPLDVAIVVLTPPLFPSAVQGLRLLRFARVFRVLRLAPLARVVFSFEGLKATLGLAVLTAVAGGAGFAAEASRLGTASTGRSPR
jgi:voltage-gated potassium channel